MTTKREILFRGKDLFNRNKGMKQWKGLFRGRDIDDEYTNWYYGYYIGYDFGSQILYYEDDDLSQSCCTVDSNTVGQYTGIDDKNGVKIFEADILKVKDSLPGGEMEFVGVVDFINGSFVIVNEEMTHYRWIDCEIEVIGNKFDNPELLEA